MKGPLILTFILISFLCKSQNNISGKLIDNAGNPIEFVNVLLFKKPDTINIFQGLTCDSSGIFDFINIAKGQYILKFHGIGYKKQSIAIEKRHSENLIIGPYILESEIIELKDVTITRKKELIQQTKTGFIISTDASLFTQSGNALDLLRSTPMIFIDAEGAINLRGKSPLVLINGRNSKFDNLNNLPANSIEKIEIITSPGASYDAESENGIINIILKKGKAEGINGAFSIAGGLGYSWRLNNSFLVNYKKNKWNLGLGYDNRLAERNRKAEGDRTNFNLPSQYYLKQRRNDERKEEIHNIRSNIDFKGEKKSFGAEMVLGIEKETNFETLYNTIYNQEYVFQNKSRRYSDERRKGYSAEIALKYELEISKDKSRISTILSTSFGDGLEKTPIISQDLSSENIETGVPFMQKTSFSDFGSNNIFKLDYFQKISNATFETGFKTLFRKFANDFSREDQIDNNYVLVPNRTGSLTFEEWVPAIYTQLKNEIGKWSYEIGLRMEQTYNSGTVKSLSIDFNNNYINLFPNANLSYQISDIQNIRFIYGRRINRPSLGQLNPFTDITDSLTQRSGNPTLLPEIAQNAELNYDHEFNKGSFSVKPYYRNSHNSILPFTKLMPNGVLFTQPLNAGSTTTLGLETLFSFEVNKAWKTNLSSSIFNQNINAQNIQSDILNQVTSWNAKWTNDIIVKKNSRFQINAFYNSPTATIQGRRIAIYNVDFAFQQKIIREKGRLGLIITDVFNTQKNGFIWETKDFYFSRIFKVDTRAILITFAYTFGTSFKEKLMDNKFSND
ncbi:MAG: outer membrane beta-barrel family protein [Spirosomataceae bacterium]